MISIVREDSPFAVARLPLVAAAAMAIETGTRLGRYEIRSPLAVGGMGEVYLARDIELERTVALKILKEDAASNRQRMRRFMQEARAVSALNHPYIVTIYEIGEAVGAHFIATEFIDGETLRQRIKRGRLKLDEAIEVGIQTASALAAAHAAGIIHRDIKPENIMLRHDGYVKVLDFGIAKLEEQTTGHHPAEPEAPTRPLFPTDEGMVMGTLRYMSPEQTRGLEVDARTDIWSLGVVLYEMITGRAPFDAPTRSDIIVSILERPAAPLATLSDVPTELERIVSKTLAKNKEQRYQTIKDLAIDLRQLKQRLDVITEMERARAVETSVEMARATGNTSSSTSGANPAPARRSTRRKAIDSLAVLPLVNASRDANTEYLSDGVTESIINSLSRLPKLRVMARSTVFRYKGREVDALEAGRELGVRAVLLGRVVMESADRLVIKTELVDASDGALLWGGQYDRKLTDLFAVQEDISREIVGHLSLHLTGAEKKRLAKRSTENAEAYQAYLKGRYHLNKFTDEGLKKSIEFFREASDIDPNYALAYAGLADCYYRLSNMSLAPREAMPKVKAAAMKALELDETVAEAHVSLALVACWYEWDWKRAEQAYRRAIKFKPNSATAHQRFGVYLSMMGRLDESIEKLTRAQELDHLTLKINVNLGATYFYARQYDRAIEQCRKTLLIDPSFVGALCLLGWCYEQLGRHDEAVGQLRKAAEISDLPEVTAMLGHAYAVADRRDEARGVLDKLQELSEERYVTPYYRGAVCAGLGELEEALAWLEKAYQERDEWLLHLKVDPKFDPLRDDPRFAEMLKRINL
ncbi:MAG TPA: protein kinase [Pyrinomonadaceae bacterium]